MSKFWGVFVSSPKVIWKENGNIKFIEFLHLLFLSIPCLPLPSSSSSSYIPSSPSP
jgi:hypothetical protein